MEEEEEEVAGEGGEEVTIMVGGTVRGQDHGAIMVVTDIETRDVRVRDQETEAGRQEKTKSEVRARVHQGGRGEALQGGRRRGRKERGRGKERETKVRMGQRGLIIKVLCQIYIKHDA